MKLPVHGKVTSAHLERNAYLYVRQSTLQQVECGGLRRLLAAIFDPVPIRRILLHLGLPADPPAVAPARPPPAIALPWS